MINTKFLILIIGINWSNRTNMPMQVIEHSCTNIRLYFEQAPFLFIFDAGAWNREEYNRFLQTPNVNIVLHFDYSAECIILNSIMN